MLHISNGHISMNIESLNMIFGQMIAHSVVHKNGCMIVVTSKMQNLMLTAALPGRIVGYILVTVISR